MTEPIKPGPEPEPIKRRCTGHSSRTGKPCKLSPVHGATVCHKHGGSAPQVKRAAERRVALGEWARTFGEPAPEADPHDTILHEIRWTAGHVAWLRDKVATTTEDALAASVWLPIYERERDRLVKQADIAIRAGVELRQVELAERIGVILGDLIARVLDDCDLTPEQQQAAAAALPRHLQLVAGELNGGRA